MTFNGRAYDLNLLSSRYILNRAQDVLVGMPHIDLLHPSRRMLAHRLENARLVTIEAHVLGVRREDDVPGYEIPQRYFDWLKRRDGRLMDDSVPPQPAGHRVHGIAFETPGRSCGRRP